MIEKEVIDPRNFERQHIYQSQNPYYRYELEPFRVCNHLTYLLYVALPTPNHIMSSLPQTRLCMYVYINEHRDLSYLSIYLYIRA